MPLAAGKGHDSLDVANQFILVARKKGNPICSLTALIKLVYIAHGYCLALKDENLIRDRIEAWHYGPVIPRIYHAFKREQPAPVPLERAQDAANEELGEYALFIIKTVHQGYGHLRFDEISLLTHRQGSPWSVVWREKGHGAEIDNEMIGEYYRGMIESAK